MSKMSWIALLGLTAALGGCVESKNQLLREENLIVDASIAGAYLEPGFLGDKPGPAHWRVALDGDRYRISGDNDIVATMHPLNEPFAIAQVRDAKGESAYVYWLIVRKRGYILLNTIPCDEAILREAHVARTRAHGSTCRVETREELLALARLAAKKYVLREMVPAIRTGD